MRTDPGASGGRLGTGAGSSAELAQTIYVSNGRGGTVTPIATATNTPGPPIEDRHGDPD